MDVVGGGVSDHVQAFLQIYTSEGLSMSHGVADKLVQWANKYCDDIKSEPLRTMSAMLAACGVGVGALKFEPADDADEDGVHGGNDRNRLTHMGLDCNSKGGSRHEVAFYYRDLASSIRDVLTHAVVKEHGVVVKGAA
jgi:hypothetical protein